MEPQDAPAAFIVRLSHDESGRVTGVVERVRTGEKERFDSLEAIGRVIARMVASDRPAERPES